MIIEIRRAAFVNKGAELMLRAALAKLRAAYPEAVFAMAPTINRGPRPLGRLNEYGLRPKAWLYSCGMQWGDAVEVLPRGLRRRYGIVVDKDVDVVIDTAGFAYGDQWGLRNTQELAHAAVRWRKRNTKVALIPQAFGPFTGARIRDYMRAVIDNVDLIIARDTVSYKYLCDIAGEQKNIRIFPDYTNLLQGTLPDYFDSSHYRICLVPNRKMIDMTGVEAGRRYVPFMVRCAQHLNACSAGPFILCHEGPKDLRLAQIISKEAGGIPILVEEDPQAIKGILGACHATIGGRFHGLVSALSQGVPSLATGWSHKYIELMKDYGFPQGLVDVACSDRELIDKLKLVIDDHSNSEIRVGLARESARLKRLSEQMWDHVFTVIQSRLIPSS